VLYLLPEDEDVTMSWAACVWVFAPVYVCAWLQSEMHGSKPKDESPAEGFQRHLMTSPLIRAPGRVRPGPDPPVVQVLEDTQRFFLLLCFLQKTVGVLSCLYRMKAWGA
jgi:hypothetical protein